MARLAGVAAVVGVLAVCMGVMAEEGGKAELRQYSLPDPYLQCTAWTFVAPGGWAKEGGVVWTGRNAPGPAYETELSVGDGAREFRLFPVYTFIEASGPIAAPGSEIRPVLRPADCIEQVILKRCRPEAREVRVIWSESLPGLAARMVAMEQASGLAAMDKVRVRSGRVLVEYSVGGEAVEEMVYCTVIDAPGPMNTRVWTTERAFSYRAPKGKLEESMAVLGTIGRSLKENPQWIALRRQTLQQMAAAVSASPQSSAGQASIVDVSRKESREQDEFLRGLDGAVAGQDAVAREGEVGSGYLQYYREHYGPVHGGEISAPDLYTAYRVVNATELEARR